MSEQIAIKHKTEPLSLFRWFSASRLKESVLREQKEEYLQELAESIHDAYLEWQNALSNFENAEGKEMVDYYAYRIKASQIRYEYLLRKAKDAQAQ
ncbi:MAG: YaaL family protein [Clostridia bacterium]|nr:YaaL family protein [Clostridia bacterium]